MGHEAAAPQALVPLYCHVQVVACSAMTGQGVLEGFSWLVHDISQRIYLIDL